MASGESLEIIGEIKIVLKIQGFSWWWVFLVSRKLQGSPILGVDFLSKTKMVMDIGNSRVYFAFAPQNYIKLGAHKGKLSYCYTLTMSDSGPAVECGNLTVSQEGQLRALVQQYPDVLTPKLGLTHVLEYEIQLLDRTPVRLAPYRLAPPKMQHLR
jgi:hypothetical protein